MYRAKFTEPFGYLFKPFVDRELKTAIELALYRYRQDQERKQIVSDVIVELSKGKK